LGMGHVHKLCHCVTKKFSFVHVTAASPPSSSSSSSSSHPSISSLLTMTLKQITSNWTCPGHVSIDVARTRCPFPHVQFMNDHISLMLTNRSLAAFLYFYLSRYISVFLLLVTILAMWPNQVRLFFEYYLPWNVLALADVVLFTSFLILSLLEIQRIFSQPVHLCWQNSSIVFLYGNTNIQIHTYVQGFH